MLIAALPMPSDVLAGSARYCWYSGFGSLIGGYGHGHEVLIVPIDVRLPILL